MHRLQLLLDVELYRQLKSAAQVNNRTLEEECLGRLESGDGRSCYVQALVAELRADDEQRRATQRRSG